ncbi:MAG: YqgE/AlgH family protein [Candidatus Methylomirabilales bacterium]
MARAARLIGLILAVGLAAAGGQGVPAAERPQAPGLSGRFLVATDELRDPRFARTVVYLVHHGPGGAMGIVVNRPIDDVPLAKLLESAEMDATGVSGTVPVHYGGPVDRGRGFVLHSADYQQAGTHLLARGIALTTDAQILRAIGTGKGPAKFLMALGYAGWAPGQLEGEIAAGAWVDVPADPALLFDEPAERKWERAMARRTIVL